jgi:hypothetical protein
MQSELDKRVVARAQLGTALALFLEDLDPISVHTLACAGSEIAEHLSRQAGAMPFSIHALQTFPDLDIRELKTLRNQYWNAFKHATDRRGLKRQDAALFRRFSDEVNDHTLFVGWYDYVLAVGRLPLEAQAFQAWYLAVYWEKLAPEVDPARYAEAFPGIAAMNRSQRKKALRESIEAFRDDDELMNDPRTDNAPLLPTRT